MRSAIYFQGGECKTSGHFCTSATRTVTISSTCVPTANLTIWPCNGPLTESRLEWKYRAFDLLTPPACLRDSQGSERDMASNCSLDMALVGLWFFCLEVIGRSLKGIWGGFLEAFGKFLGGFWKGKTDRKHTHTHTKTYNISQVFFC